MFSSTLFRLYINPVSLGSLYLAVDHLKVTTAKPVIRKLKAYIARYVIPDEIVSSEFQQFSKDYMAWSIPTQARTTTKQMERPSRR